MNSIMGMVANRVLRSPILGEMAAKFDKPLSRGGVMIDPSQDSLPPYIATKFLLGRYEINEKSLLDLILSQEDNVIELGGGIGVQSCLINASLNSPSNHVVVEANNDLIDVLKRHRELNDAEYTIVHAAYSPTQLKVSFGVRDESRILGSSKHRNTEKEITVSTTDIETLADKKGFNEYTVVADIEGSEKELIEEELDELSQRASNLLIEFHWPVGEITKPDVEEMKDKLESQGFEPIRQTMDGRVVAYKNSTRF